ncbi:MAG TPA: response regulator [Candidatus Methylomirabilis sp.]|nr:response regulator [Candidatus Methylomirabilis sp.]
MSKILLVDDDVDLMAQYQTALSGTGHELIAAYSASEARQLLKTMTPDLAVLDVMMENGFPGFDLAIEIHSQAPDVPVLMVSSINERLKAPVPFGRDENLPIHKFLNKPVPPKVLRQEVESALASAKKR